MTIQEYMKSPAFQRDWDIVFASGYFVLVDGLREELSLVRDLLKPGGLLFMLNSNWKSLGMSLAHQYPHQMYRFVYPPGNTHVFCDETYEFICREFGFVKKALWCFGMDVYELLNQLVALGRVELHSPEHEHLSAQMADFQLALDKMQMSDYTHVLLQKT